jgi:Predicted membrane protein (DUF2142)
MSATSTRDEARRGDSLWHRLRSFFSDAANCFLAIGIVGGVALVVIIPPFGGIDEPAHWARAYQVSTGRFVPEHPAGSDEGGGVCLPDDVADDFERLVTDYTESVYERGDVEALESESDSGVGALDTSEQDGTCAADEQFYDFSAFAWNSPVAYVPQAFVIWETRALGIGVEGQVYAARLAVLAVYLALVYIAIRRTPYARWGLCAVGLLPVALFQAASSRAPDAITTAVAMLVLVSALRAAKAATDRAEGSTYGERIGLAATLGLLKPTYSVVALCFLLPWFSRPRRESLARLVWPVAAAVGVSGLWQLYAGDYFICDTFAFGFNPDPSEQVEGMLRSPHRYAVAVLESFGDYWDKWLDELVTVGETVANWSWWTIGLALVALALVAAKRDPRENFELRLWQQISLLAIVFAGMVFLITGEHVYCANISLTIDYPPHARHYVPLLGLLVAALTPTAHIAKKVERVPAAALLFAVTVAFVVGTALEMRF